MATYTPSKFPLPNGLDEVGYHFSMFRLPNETLDNFRRRILEESRIPAGASQSEFIRSINRQVGLQDIALFEIELVEDGNGDSLAVDPYIEITSSHIRAYNDYANNEIDIELNLYDREEALFITDVKDEFDSSTYFDLTVLVDGNSYLNWYSKNLMYSNTNEHVVSEPLLESRSNLLDNSNIFSLKAQNFQLFQTEKNSVGDLEEEGDFYIDYKNGVVFTESPASGFVSYSYRKFPFTIYWQPVRAYPLNDPDNKYINYDTRL